ncbi:MAG: SLOG family protein [Rikenellaceae bacterium]
MNIKRECAVAFTGNRNLTSPDKASGSTLEKRIRNKLYALLEEQYNQGKYQFLCGYALGWDMLAAEEVLRLQKLHPEIELIAVIPFDGQEEKFPFFERLRYRKLRKRATYTVVIAQEYSNQAYHDRNDYMLANASKVIAYHNGKPRSGTGSTIRKATEQGIEVVNLYDEI